MSDSKFNSLLIFLGVLLVPLIWGGACYAIEYNDTISYERMVSKGIPAEIAACVDYSSEPAYLSSEECLAQIYDRIAQERYSCEMTRK